MTVIRRASIETIAVESTTVNHMTVHDLLKFATEVREAVDLGLDMKAPVGSNYGHLNQMSVLSEVVDPALCGETFTPPPDTYRATARCRRAAGHIGAHSINGVPPELLGPEPEPDTP